MAKIVFNILFLFLVSFSISCLKDKHSDDLSITIEEFKNDRLYYEIINNSTKEKKIFINEIPNVYINKNNIEKHFSFKPFSVKFCSKKDLKVKVNIFANKDYINGIKNNITKEIILNPKEKFHGNILVDTIGKYSFYTPHIGSHKNVKLRLIYNGKEMNKAFKIKNDSYYVDQDIVSNNEIILK